VQAPVRRLGALFGGENGQAKDEDTIWALQDVSFEVKQGEVVGIIGQNGAGKSTLLKILSRITEPTCGRVEIHGRVGSLLEVGTGFHPELTGRENIFLNGAILGMKKAEIVRRFDEIVAFAEVEKFIDTPVKRYSSGMYLRLAFAVAAHLDPEILLVDEVLAVGDTAFQKKCLGKMGGVAKEGRTVLFVSHNMQAILSLTAKSILIAKGSILYFDNTNIIVQRYYNVINNYLSQGISNLTNIKRSGGDQKIKLTRLILKNRENKITNSFSPRDKILITFEFYSELCSNEFEIGFGVRTLDGTMLFVSSSSDCGKLFKINKGMYEINSSIDPNFLKPGKYYLAVGITCQILRDLIMEAHIIDINNDKLLSNSPLLTMPGSLFFNYTWSSIIELGNFKDYGNEV